MVDQSSRERGAFNRGVERCPYGLGLLSKDNLVPRLRRLDRFICFSPEFGKSDRIKISAKRQQFAAVRASVEKTVAESVRQRQLFELSAQLVYGDVRSY